MVSKEEVRLECKSANCKSLNDCYLVADRIINKYSLLYGKVPNGFTLMAEIVYSAARNYWHSKNEKNLHI